MVGYQVPNSFTAEGMAKMGWDSLTIDLQHGINEYLDFCIYASINF